MYSVRRMRRRVSYRRAQYY
nr:hypothetical protein [Musicola paradisiaca]